MENSPIGLEISAIDEGRLLTVQGKDDQEKLLIDIFQIFLLTIFFRLLSWVSRLEYPTSIYGANLLGYADRVSSDDSIIYNRCSLTAKPYTSRTELVI